MPLSTQATGTWMPPMASIDSAVGTSTMPLARIRPDSTIDMPMITLLHNMMCSSVCAMSTTAGSVMNSPMMWRENR